MSIKLHAAVVVGDDGALFECMVSRTEDGLEAKLAAYVDEMDNDDEMEGMSPRERIDFHFDKEAELILYELIEIELED